MPRLYFFPIGPTFVDLSSSQQAQSIDSIGQYRSLVKIILVVDTCHLCRTIVQPLQAYSSLRQTLNKGIKAFSAKTKSDYQQAYKNGVSILILLKWFNWKIKVGKAQRSSLIYSQSLKKQQAYNRPMINIGQPIILQLQA